MNSGTKLWQRAKKLIPGGGMLLSKRAEMYLPEEWPAYFSRTQGCRVWDLDDNEYLDIGMMGIGTNILGYSHHMVDKAVRQVIDNGNLCTLNAPEEVYLAEKLCELHPWADMVRFARSGGEACAIAVRIARAASGKSKVAFSGYHGWHDWYLSANLSGDLLDGLLLPGLEPAGVPAELMGTAIPFKFNDIDRLKEILASGEIGVIMMEVQRNATPSYEFLSEVRALATQYNAVLVFDECTSGFREKLGGLHLKFGVEPDIATFGKTLGNGYGITAVVGRESVMQGAQKTFISSTFWTERIGPAAAIATLKVMEEVNAPAEVHRIGLTVLENWNQLATSHNLKITLGEFPALATYRIDDRDPLVIKSFVVREFLQRGILGGMALYTSIAHKPEVLDRYFRATDEIFAAIAKFDDDELKKRIPQGLAHGGFARLN